MQTDLEQMTNMIRSLPVEDLDKLGKLIEEERRAKSRYENGDSYVQEKIEKYKKARKWINEHTQEYMGEWVCLEDDQLIAHGKDGLEVHRKAKEAGIKAPFLHHVIDESLPFGGW
ncbi:MAG: hypothetical protein KF855_04865 [Acidobacteria bacterium]|nr:hypothetical protein [Acidobacteriota bacterium]